ncbi:MAG: sigma-70 family RNA polymerase sigma factor [Dehalococcoidia bacterium]|nr:sigma-70 family RNA polymerase sigma factor [Dehalococcoidia bacterium]
MRVLIRRGIVSGTARAGQFPPLAAAAPHRRPLSPILRFRLPAWRRHTATQRSRQPRATRQPDEERLAALARDDGSAFSGLYETYVNRVYHYLLGRTSSQSEAEELTSRTFLNAFANLDRYRARGSGFSSWLMAIAHNLLVNWYRDRGRRPPTAPLDEALDAPADAPGPESSLERTESIRQVRTAVEGLAPDRQQLIALKYVDGLSNSQIGRIMGRTEGAVKSLHHRTLRQLHGALADAE